MPKGFENVVVPDDVYQAKLVEVDDVVAQVTGKFGTKPRLLARWEIQTPQGVKKIPQFLNPDVRKGSGTYSNTSTYDLIAKSGELGKFAAMVGTRTSVTDAEVINFLKFGVVGKSAKILTKSRTRGDGTQYTCVKELVAFV
jgi:hypothetical protein